MADLPGNLNASFIPGNPYPYLYDERDVVARTMVARDAAPEMTSSSGVRVFDMAKESDVKDLQGLVQLVAWNQAKFDTFHHQFDQNTGNFKILCVWRRFFRMASTEIAKTQMAVWNSLGV